MKETLEIVKDLLEISIFILTIRSLLEKRKKSKSHKKRKK